MKEKKCIHIKSGKELLDSGITRFEVLNGGWVGEVVIRNNESYLERRDLHGNLVSMMRLHNDSYIGLTIEPWKYESRKAEQMLQPKQIDIFYLCNNEACLNSCNANQCKHTSNIEHAVHKNDMNGRLFEYMCDENGNHIGFFEKEVEDDTDN